jgi:hypothetical protein
MGALGPPDRGFIAVGHDNKKVNIAAVMRIAPSMRAEKPDLIRLKFRDEPLRCHLEQAVFESFHGGILAPETKNGKLKVTKRFRSLGFMAGGLQISLEYAPSSRLAIRPAPLAIPFPIYFQSL